MRRIGIDAITQRYFPRVGNRLVRYTVSIAAFALYSYFVFPFKKLATDRLNAITVVLLFIFFVMADSSYLASDISRVIDMPHATYDGIMIEYEGRRGLGTPHIVVSDGHPKRFKLLTIRGKGVNEILKRQLGKRLQIDFIEAKGLLTCWSLPIHISLSNGELIYDYRQHLDWFENPLLPIDKAMIAIFNLLFVFSLIYFPMNFLRCLLGQEVRHEHIKQNGT